MYCVALDPGGTTGVCNVMKQEEPWHLAVRQLGPDPHHMQLMRYLTLWKPEVIVCESFENRSQDAAVLASSEYIGVVKAYAGITQCKLVMQSAGLVKPFWNDDKLRRYGVYAPRLKHARDACRHYLYYRTFGAKDLTLLNGSDSGSFA